MKLYENICKATRKPRATEYRENCGPKRQGDAEEAVVRAGWGWLGKASQSGVGVCVDQAREGQGFPWAAGRHRE